MRTLLPLLALVAGSLSLLGCAPSSSPPQAPGAAASAGPGDGETAARLGALEERLARLEVAASASVPPPAPPAQSWSCAGQCVTSFRCVTSGDSNVKFREVYGTGALATDAFRDLRRSCGSDDLLVVSARCRDGKLEHQEATLANACVRN